MKYDVSFLSPKKELVEIPLKVTGKVTGVYTIVQQFIGLLFATESNIREFGGNLGGMLQGTNVNEDYVKDAFSLAAAETTDYLHNNGVIIGSCEVTNVSINADSISISADLFVSGETVSLSMSIFLQES